MKGDEKNQRPPARYTPGPDVRAVHLGLNGPDMRKADATAALAAMENEFPQGSTPKEEGHAYRQVAFSVPAWSLNIFFSANHIAKTW